MVADKLVENYKCLRKNGHIIHIVTLNPREYNVEIVKAREQVFGRETI